MKRLNTADLRETLREDSVFLLEQIEEIGKNTPHELLETNDGKGRWNTVQVLEHLNGYYRFYIPRMNELVEKSKSEPSSFFQPGWLGNYFTRTIMPKNGVVKNKMKAMKNHSPDPDLDTDAVIAEFLGWQRQFILLIERSAKADLESIRVPITIAPFIKLRLGDMLMFLVAHNQRHWIQVEQLLGRYHVASPGDAFTQLAGS